MDNWVKILAKKGKKCRKFTEKKNQEKITIMQKLIENMNQIDVESLKFG